MGAAFSRDEILPSSFNLEVDDTTAQSDASSFSHFDCDIAPLFEPLEELCGLIRTGDGLVIHTYNQVSTS